MTTMREMMGDSSVEFEKEYRKTLKIVMMRKEIPSCEHDSLIEELVHDCLDKYISEEEEHNINESVRILNKKAEILCEVL